MSLRILIYGDVKAEHLYAKLHEDGVEIVSHELATTVTSSNWRERTFATIPKDKWLEIAEALKKGGQA